MAGVKIPTEARQWLTDEIRTLLAAIGGGHAAKKRTTVIKLAFAKANQTPLKTVFDQDDTCAEVIWYQKWQYLPEVKAAFEACYQRALDWADAETAAIEAHYRQQRRRSVAEWAAKAPESLAVVMMGEAQRGADRISAANALISWADPDAASKARPASPAGNIEQSVVNLVGLSDEEIDAELERLEQKREGALPAAEAGAGEAPTGAAEADDSGGKEPGAAIG